MRRSQLVALLIAVGALLIACGGGGSMFEDPGDDDEIGEAPSDDGICTEAEAAAGKPCRIVMGDNWQETDEGELVPLR